jgi:hypothetical protein
MALGTMRHWPGPEPSHEGTMVLHCSTLCTVMLAQGPAQLENKRLHARVFLGSRAMKETCCESIATQSRSSTQDVMRRMSDCSQFLAVHSDFRPEM